MLRPFVPADIRNLHPEGEATGLEGSVPPSSDSMAQDLHRLASLRIITQGITARSVTVTSQPTLLIRASRDRAYTIVNPTPSVGLTSSGIYIPPTNITVAGNSQVTPLGVANYDTLHLFLNVSNVAGATLNVIAQVISPINGAWIDTQDLVPAGITANGDIYANLGNFGVTTQFALRWTIAGTCTLAAGFVLKGGLGGSSAGLASTVFIGNAGVNPYAGYPLLEGQTKDFYMVENAELWGITTSANIVVNVIELS